MALTPDQRAMLQLLLDKGQRYEDIASLTGDPVQAVSARARDALHELAGEDPDAAVGLTDYLLGQADPIGRADAARHLQNDEHALHLARDIVMKLQLIAPQAELPELPQPSRGGTLRAVQPEATDQPRLSSVPPQTRPASTRQPRNWSLPKLSPRQLIAALVAGAVLVVAIVLVAGGVFGGGESSKKKAQPDGDEVPIKLSGARGARGEAIFARVGKKTNQIAFRINATGLKPTPKDQGSTYTIWMYIDAKSAYPLAPVVVPANGELQTTRPVPSILTSTSLGLAALSCFQELRISLTPTDQLRALITAATQKNQFAVPYVGTTALRGKIPGSAGKAECAKTLAAAIQASQQPAGGGSGG